MISYGKVYKSYLLSGIMKSKKEIKEKLEELNQVVVQIKKTIWWKESDEMKGVRNTLLWVLDEDQN